MITESNVQVSTITLIPVTARFEAQVCGHSIAGIAGSNSAKGMDVYILRLMCVVYCIVVGSRRLMPPDALQPKAYCTNPGL